MAEALKLHIWGGDGRARGYQASDSVLVNELADGVTLEQIWGEVADALDLYNRERSAITNLLCYRTTNAAEAVAQNIGTEKFEEATEYGVPRGIGDIGYLKLGMSLKDYDLGLRMSWKYLRDATSDQVQNRISRALESDNRLVTGTILNRLFSNVTRTNEFGHSVFGLWSGDGMVPPPHLGKSFDGSHTHLLPTGSTTLDSEDVEIGINHVRQHGYGGAQAARFLLLMNPNDVETSGITAWRAGVSYRSGGPLPKWDFIPSSNAPARLTAERVEGAVPPPDYYGLECAGSYGNSLLIQSYFIPSGYAAVVASGGPGSESNPIALREHTNPRYQGLRLLPGRDREYPLIESYMLRTFGVGVRHRGAACCFQITTNPTYTPPAAGMIPV